MANVKVGDEIETKRCGLVKVIEYKAWDDITVMFIDTKTTVKTRSDKLKTGSINDVLAPTVYSVGYIGEGLPKGFAKSRAYKLWSAMLQRCYDSAFTAKHPTYQGCTVSENFKSFQYFSNWCERQIGFNSAGFQLDKDILSGSAKYYSEDTCVFVPAAINGFVSGKIKKGVGVLGVYQNKGCSTFYVRVGFGSDERAVKTFKSKVLAKDYYTNEKMIHIQKLIGTWSGSVDPRVIKFLSDLEG